jgi:O-antigen ligase
MSLYSGITRESGLIDLKNTKLFIGIFMALGILSSVSILILGIKSLYILGGILILFAVIKFEIFPLLLLFLAEGPVTILFRSKASLIIYSIVFLIITKWALIKLMKENPTIQYSKTLLVFSLCFLAVSLLSVINGPMTSVEIVGFGKLVIFFILANIIYDIYEPKNTLTILVSVLIPIFIMSMFIIVRYLQASSLIDLVMLFRSKGNTFYWPINFNAFAAKIVLILPFCWAMSLFSESINQKIFYNILAVLISIALVLSAARAALFGFLVAIIVLMVLAKKTKYLISITFFLLLVLIIFPQIITIVSIAMRVELGTTGRTVIWADMLKLIQKNFLFGIGIDSFQEVYFLNFPLVHWMERIVPHDAHNQILDWTVRLGILGFPLAISVYYLSIKNGILAMKKYTGRNVRAVIIGIFGGIIAILARSLFESGALLLSNVFLFPAITYWLLLIMLVKINTIDENAIRVN